MIDNSRQSMTCVLPQPMFDEIFKRSPNLDIKDANFPFPIQKLVYEAWKAAGPLPYKHGLKYSLRHEPLIISQG